jgi:hypothetical protein
MLDTGDMKLIREVMGEVKTDFVREVTSLKGDMASRVSTLNTQMIAEFKIVSDRLGDHKRAIDAELSRLRIDLETEKINHVKAITRLETKPCSDVKLHVATEHGTQAQVQIQNGHGTWSRLRDVALIVTMLGVAYGVSKDLFVTQRDLVKSAPAVSGGR